uniref:Truncated 3b protein n=1 Tax=Avian infectious bronchitis virus (strain Beaudette) TaxID=11122 RepID=A0AAU8NZY0_IBVB|nr:truncated 3b protein [Infectious bronchitis virus]
MLNLEVIIETGEQVIQKNQFQFTAYFKCIKHRSI